MPEKDRIKIKAALREMEGGPFFGDIKSLHNYATGWPEESETTEFSMMSIKTCF